MRPFFGLVALVLVVASVACSGAFAQSSAPAFVLGEPAVLRYETDRDGVVDLVTNVWERDYAVPGATASEVSDNLDALRRSTGHGPYSANTQWDLQLSLRYANEPGSCRIAGATIEVLAVVTMPGLADGSALSSQMRQRWNTYIDSLRAHELQHIENEVAGGRALQSQLNALGTMSTCREVGDEANALLTNRKQLINQADASLDAETEHGARTGATFP
jgi:predicted secreted Zn-dependent protease